MMLRTIAYVAQPESGASARYRVYQWREPLRALGIQLDIMPFFDARAVANLYARGAVLRKSWDLARRTMAWLPALRAARHYDLAFVHRSLWPLAGNWPLAMLRSGQPRWAFDIDDAVFLPKASEANRRFVALKSHSSIVALATGARAVSAGNSWLAQWARSRRGGRAADDVEVIPTAVDSDLWVPAGRTSDGPVRLLWIGSPSTLGYLVAWGPVLARLCARHPGLELHVIGAKLALPGVRCVSHAWSAATERAIAQCCDIGLAPLADGDWERGKCGLKLLLYMALGLPAVASRAGVHGEILTPGEDGVLVDDDEALEAMLDRLVKDAAMRATLGRAARATLVSRYSIRAVAPKLAGLLRRAAESARTGART